LLAVSDPAIIAALADGTLLVANSQKTRGQRAAHAVATLKGAGARVLGIVLNGTETDGRSAYGYYGADQRESRAPSIAL
jgi:receptor protein-tyrosine kinase